MKQNNTTQKTPIQKGNPLLSPYAYPPDKVAEERARQLRLYEGLRLVGNSPKEAADKLRIVLRTISRWRAQQKRHSLCPVSRCPKRVRQPTLSNKPDLQEAIIRQRDFYHCGKIRLHLYQQQEGWTVSQTTVGRMVREMFDNGKMKRLRVGKKRRLLGNPPPKRDVEPYTPPLAGSAPGDRVQMDTMGVTLKHYQVRVLTAVGYESRYVWAKIVHRQTASRAASFLKAILATSPFEIKAVQTDGGGEFMGEFEKTDRAKGIKHIVIPPRSPKCNGHVESFHNTQRRELYNFCSGRITPIELRRKTAKFIKYYNEERMHGFVSPIIYLNKTPPNCHM